MNRHPERGNAPESPSIARRLLAPLDAFLRVEAASGIVLLLAALLALGWANSPWRGGYEALWATPLTLGLDALAAVPSVRWWVNDGLMTIFFLVVGLEIRRELHDGALASVQQALLPAVAALGGVIAPALVFLALSGEPELRRGWAVPTATDIAFAVGLLALLGQRVPAALRVLLLAVAIIDDVAAILIIAFVYSGGVGLTGLGIALLGVLGVLLLQRLRVASAWAYVVPGAVVWGGLLQAGLHPTLAGVVLGLLTPVRAWAPSLAADTGPPALRVETALHPWVAYGVMPLFALANAGVDLAGVSWSAAGTWSVFLGVACGLILGKPLGIVAATALAVRLRLCALPDGVTWRGVTVIGLLAGIGFTMSIFIATLAFAEPALLAAAKFAVLVASATAALVGLGAGRLLLAVTARKLEQNARK